MIFKNLSNNFGPAWGHHDEGIKVDTGLAEVHPVYNRRLVENPQG
jgi:hypothetical protein